MITTIREKATECQLLQADAAGTLVQQREEKSQETMRNCLKLGRSGRSE